MFTGHGYRPYTIQRVALGASATSDVGPGTYTMGTMIAAEYLGLKPEQVKFEIGDTRLPRAPSQGGSKTTASVGSPIYGAALAITARLLSLAQADSSSPLSNAPLRTSNYSTAVCN
ncbi:MAG: molybdopterin cofactor-binding domain-containing protein [Thermoanaerobaculia bacterium]